ncbi:hypothetical protein TorRG33x02_337480, partial [Trema orientale]
AYALMSEAYSPTNPRQPSKVPLHMDQKNLWPLAHRRSPEELIALSDNRTLDLMQSK